MNYDEKKQMKELLESMREDVLKNLNKLKDVESPDFIFEEDGDMHGIPYHLADQGTYTMDQERNYLIMQKECEYLYEIDQALKLLEEDKYGFCETCGKVIHFDRLQAIPFARYCIECKNKLERNNNTLKNHGRSKQSKPYIINEFDDDFEMLEY